MRLVVSAAIGLLACASCASAAAPAGFAPVAHSALVTVEGVVAADTLILRVRRTADQQPLTGAELALTVDGRSIALTARPEGGWGVPLASLPAGSSGKLSIVVAHDGLREVLDGQLPAGPAAPAAGPSGGLARTLIHKQMAWWILNVVIVLVGVIAISRRMS